MKRAQHFVVWLAALGITGALLFPPYGYRSISTTSIGAEVSESTKRIAWTYVSHGFIFAQPPGPPLFDPIEGDRGFVMIRTAGDHGIYWAAVAAEIASILALSLAAFVTIPGSIRLSRQPASSDDCNL